jgi:hypothetical protein
MTIGIGALYLAQGDGGLPTTSAAGSAPGESGVSVFSLRFCGGMHFGATTQQHLIWFASPVRIDCRIAGRTLRHEAPAGSLVICPAGADCVPTPRKVSMPFSSPSIPASWPSPPPRVRRLKRS